MATYRAERPAWIIVRSVLSQVKVDEATPTFRVDHNVCDADVAMEDSPIV